ncbi:MAG: outer membrane protein assembly factor BamD [Bradymonadia bacterium]
MKKLLFPLIALLAVACGGKPTPKTYADHARMTYLQGMEALEDGDYIEATQLFSSVKTKYPYSQFAALAELRVGDTYYEQDQFVEAVGAYRTFVRRRPNHAEVGYAMWRIGEAFFQQRPSDFFILPPSFERDRGTTKDAVQAYRAFLQRFPKHKKSDSARERLLKCRRVLADFELYVAKFYLKRDKTRASIARLQGIVASFDDVPRRWLEASLILLDTYTDTTLIAEDVGIPDRDAKAKALVDAIVRKFPGTSVAKLARSKLTRR